MRITVIGTGYVGLVAGACFADSGNDVICVDTDRMKTEALKRGEIPIYEPGLDQLVRRGLKEGRLRFTTSAAEAVPPSDIIFMAVGTPMAPSGEPDLTALKSACEDVARAMNGYKVIVNKSTVPIGAHKTVAEWIGALTSHEFDVVANPEFLKEGSALEDFLKPDRVIIGTDKQDVYIQMSELYSPFVRQGNPVIWTDAVSAEITQYACNAFLATRISFMNELAGLCEAVGGDIEEVRRGMSSDDRIGPHFLYAGLGYGGSCFPKDVKALLSTAKGIGTPMEIVTAAEAANARQKQRFISQITGHFGADLSRKTFAVWGLSFKPNTDDVRESPAIAVIQELLKAGASIRAYDPVAVANSRTALGEGPKYCSGSYHALEGSDALLICTDWNEFRNPDLVRVKRTLKQPIIFDGRNLFNPAQMKELGFKYFSFGR